MSKVGAEPIMSLSLNYLFDRMAVPKKSLVSRNKEQTFLNESQPVLSQP